jgi:hypothetical protein
MRLHRLIGGRDVEGPPDIQRIQSIFCKPVISQLAKVRRKLSSIYKNCISWKVEFQAVGKQHGFESWRVLNLETRTTFNKAVDHIRASNVSNCFDPMSMRVAKYDSSWNIQLCEEGGALTVTESRRRFGCIFSGSVVQALVADDAGAGCKEDKCFELRTAQNDADMHPTHFSLSFWLFIGAVDVSSLVRMHHILQATRSVHHTRLCFLVCEKLFEELFLCI